MYITRTRNNVTLSVHCLSYLNQCCREAVQIENIAQLNELDVSLKDIIFCNQRFCEIKIFH
jgi:hypothetical protein